VCCRSSVAGSNPSWWCHSASYNPHGSEGPCSSFRWAQWVMTKDCPAARLLLIPSCPSASCSPQPAWPVGVCEGVKDWMSIAGVDVMVNSCLSPHSPHSLLWRYLGTLINSTNFWDSIVLRFGLALDSTTYSCSQITRRSRLSIGTVHMTASQQARMVPPTNTWPWSLTFTILTGTYCHAWTRVLAMFNPSLWGVFILGSTRPFTASRGPLVVLSPPSHIQLESPRRWPE
jgi:hypothetical protein